MKKEKPSPDRRPAPRPGETALSLGRRTEAATERSRAQPVQLPALTRLLAPQAPGDAPARVDAPRMVPGEGQPAAGPAPEPVAPVLQQAATHAATPADQMRLMALLRLLGAL